MNRIQEVVIKPIRPQQGLIGFVSFVLDGSLFVSSIGLHERLDGQGYRLTYPTKKCGTTNIELFHPITRELSKEIESMVFAEAMRLFRK